LDSLSISNRILAKLPRGDYQRLLAKCELVTLQFGQVIYRPGGPMKYVYFPNDCMFSLLTGMGGRILSEVGLIGREGLGGIQAALGAKESPFLIIVQGGGTAMRMRTSSLTREMKRSGALNRAILRSARLVMIQFGQTAGCNRFHPLNQRLARWLLMTRDRLTSNEFQLTQEFLAAMLGVQRPRVSSAASELKRKGLVRYSRGQITITDEKGLLAASCMCYEKVKAASRAA
jgi:CRP-like cAMP-binding protein